ncbi:MAG TPA: hypothetical protein VIG25_11380, partial [Pyrinomonadaceae bacterium]
SLNLLFSPGFSLGTCARLNLDNRFNGFPHLLPEKRQYVGKPLKRLFEVQARADPKLKLGENEKLIVYVCEICKACQRSSYNTSYAKT